jgi:phosphatidate phosphatase APP1
VALFCSARPNPSVGREKHSVALFRDKTITVYPSFGYRVNGGWTIPLKVWVHKPRHIEAVPDELIQQLLSDAGPLTAQEVARCRKCLSYFIADDDSGETVTFSFEGHAGSHQFERRTDVNGIVEGEFQAPGEWTGWLTLSAQVAQFGNRYEGRTRVRLIEPEGRSIVSDIDDTIKVSEIPAGHLVVLRNTFLREYVAAEGMLARYKQFGDPSFHYVSGSPWQLFDLLHAFLIDGVGFPEGTFHMKNLRKNPLDLPAFVRDIRKFIAGKEYTKEQKLEQISSLFRNLPERTFTLIGDSGELDPEVFAELKRTHSRQVEKIIIRDVVAARETAPERLREVDEVIDAPVVVRRG